MTSAKRWLSTDSLQQSSTQKFTVGALRAKAKADGVDVSLKSGDGGAAPLAPDEVLTSSDVVEMYTRHAETR